MKKDITSPKVEGVSMAVVHETDAEGDPAWYVYLINTKKVALENVLITSRGYGELGGEERKTSEMRHFLDRLEPLSWARIERMMEDVFALSNEYWLSFYVDGVLYDKRYIFLAGSIDDANFTALPLMNKRGVLIA